MMNGTYDVQVSTSHSQEIKVDRLNILCVMTPNFLFIKSNKCITAFHSHVHKKYICTLLKEADQKQKQ